MKDTHATKVYDWPTRIFHWLFAFMFVAAYLITEFVDDENPIFSYHMMAGLTMGFMLFLRIFWGIVGTTYARFSSFKLNPGELVQYFKDVVVSKTKQYVGHNPASSYAAIAMFICAAGLALTGILMTSGNETDFYEETHELLANAFLISVILHIGGVAFHHFRHRDTLWSSMFDGKKQHPQPRAGIPESKATAGILFLLLTIVFAGYLYSQYNTTTQTLDIFGRELVLGEEEHGSGAEYERESHEEHDDDD